MWAIAWLPRAKRTNKPSPMQARLPSHPVLDRGGIAVTILVGCASGHGSGPRDQRCVNIGAGCPAALNWHGISASVRVYCAQGGPCQALPPSSEVRLPQGLRFTDVRRSAPGNCAVARCGPSASKSCGRIQLRPVPLLLCSLRIPLAAAFSRANLQYLLDRVSCPRRSCMLPLR